MVQIEQAIWIFTASERSGRLFHAANRSSRPLRLALADEIHDVWREAHQGRTDERPGDNGGYGDSHGSKNGAGDHRFAKEIAVWLEREAEERRIERVVVFAPPDLLGALREAWSPRMAMRITEFEGELNAVPAEDLVCVPAIAALLEP